MTMENEQMIRARVTGYLHDAGLGALVNRSELSSAPVPEQEPISVN